MLAMDIDESAPQFFEDSQGAQAAVEVDSVAAGPGKNPSENQLVVFGSDDVLRPKLLEQRMGARKMKGGFKLRFVLAGTDLFGRGSPADE